LKSATSPSKPSRFSPRRALAAHALPLVVGTALFSLPGCSFFAPSYEEFARGDGGAPTGAGAAGLLDRAGASGQAGAQNSEGGTASGGQAGQQNAGAGGSDAGASAAGASAAGTGGECGAEICNGKDDDCDQVIDNGCPSGFTRGFVTQEPPIGDSAGGNAFAQSCDDDEVAVGLQIAFSDVLDQVAVQCQKFSLVVKKGVVPYQYSIAMGASRLLPPHPATTNDSVQSISCAPGQVLVGLALADQSFGTNYISITRISISCAEPVLNLDAATPEIEWQNATEIGPAYGSGFKSGSAQSRTLTLSSPRLAVGFDGSAGLSVDRIGLDSSSIQITLK